MRNRKFQPIHSAVTEKPGIPHFTEECHRIARKHKTISRKIEFFGDFATLLILRDCALTRHSRLTKQHVRERMEADLLCRRRLLDHSNQRRTEPFRVCRFVPIAGNVYKPWPRKMRIADYRYVRDIG